MDFKHVDSIEVQLYGNTVGAVALPPHRPYYSFEYTPLWLENGYSISPVFMPLKSGSIRFEDLSKDTYRRLPPAIADALPDRFGNSLIETKLDEKGVTPEQITALDRLAYVGNRAMGALEFRPTRTLGKEPDIVDIAELVQVARDALSGSIKTDSQSKQALQQLLSVGVSAGGARPKAVINIDPATGAMTSGQRPEVGKESWLLKFDGVGVDKALGDSQKYGCIEYAYSLMAKAAGINMPETRLLEENGRAHFMTKRFDRTQPAQLDELPKKIHMQSLCALYHVDFNMIGVNGYASLFLAIEQLGLGEAAMVEAFRRMAFNCLAMNCDDHSKNFAFLMDERGVWSFSPAYDITFAYNSQSQWLSSHLMGVDGKFSDITSKDLMRFAEKWDIPYARVSLKKIKEAIASWSEFAEAAGLPSDVTNAISEHFVV